ncbi:rhodanese-like domain-containing protein [Ruminiclostridium cellulolyticum]|uniref:rhodanese-like domain-containing protein n=1 Tax=Ruminiclostridium cellulolyticum TaxID=1521 RepID=UPI0000E8F376|nr:rhodanese-like domain-containing protein [Ruminiclostridium cellulolyticum]
MWLSITYFSTTLFHTPRNPAFFNLSRKITNSGKKVQIIDTKVSKQYNEGHIDTAVNMSQDSLRKDLKTLDKDAVIITYCNKGVTGSAHKVY